MELNKKSFDEFVERLSYENIGKGVERHGTANPIFEVQTRRRVYCIELSEAEGVDFVDETEPECSYESIDDYMESILSSDSERRHRLLNHFKSEEIELSELDEYDKIDIAETILDMRRCGYNEYWEHVNSHFTREAAQDFINRKKHDYGTMRIYVGSQYWCWEFNAIIQGILDKKIVFKSD